MKIKCNGCNKVIDNVPTGWNRNEKCNTCGSYFTELTNVNQYPSISNQLNQIGQDMGNNISSIPHIIIGKDKTPNNTQNTNLGHPNAIDKGYEKFEKYRQYGMWIIILAVIGYAGFQIIKIIIGG